MDKEVNSNTAYYKIANLCLCINYHNGLNISRLLPNFEPFKLIDDTKDEVICNINLNIKNLNFDDTEANLLSDISIVWGNRFTFWEAEDKYWTLVDSSIQDVRAATMSSSKTFEDNYIVIDDNYSDKSSIISWFCMVAFAQCSLNYKSILFHASVVKHEECKIAFAFLGKSGTGKSTHSRLWLNSLDGYSLLNDDNPIVKVEDDGKVNIYGTPWSGKTKCYKNDKAELKGLVRLVQAPKNIFKHRSSKEALIALLPSCSALRWDSNLYATLVDSLIEIINEIQIGELHCLPNTEAAVICNKELFKL